MSILYGINNFSLSRYIKVYSTCHIIFIKINIYYNEINLDSNINISNEN